MWGSFGTPPEVVQGSVGGFGAALSQKAADRSLCVHVPHVRKPLVVQQFLLS